jgi:hypothetical protein
VTLAAHCVAPAGSFPDDLEPELHLPRVAQPCRLSEGGRNRRACDRGRIRDVGIVEHDRRGIHRRVEAIEPEVGIVEQVEDVPPELKPEPVVHPEVLVEGQIRLEIPRPIAISALGRAVGAELEAVERERRRIDDLFVRCSAWRIARLSRSVRTLVVSVTGARRAAVETRDAARVHISRLAGRGADDSADLPVAQERFLHT